MIIDAHAHADEYRLFGWIDPPERVIQLMDRAGIDISVITTYAEAPFNPAAVENLIDYVQRFPDRLLGFVRIDPKGAEEAVRVFKHTIRTEPKVKGYLEISRPPGADVAASRTVAESELARIRAAVADLLAPA